MGEVEALLHRLELGQEALQGGLGVVARQVGRSAVSGGHCSWQGRCRAQRRESKVHMTAPGLRFEGPAPAGTLQRQVRGRSAGGLADNPAGWQPRAAQAPSPAHHPPRGGGGGPAAPAAAAAATPADPATTAAQHRQRWRCWEARSCVRSGFVAAAAAAAEAGCC